MKKSSLILGVTGQDGSFLAKYLLGKGYTVHGLIRKSATGNLKNIQSIINNKSFKIHHGDLLDSSSLINVIRKTKPHEIYNFADQDHVKWSNELPNYSFMVTGAAVVNLLEIIRNYSIKSKFFQAISSNIFGNSNKKKQSEEDIFKPLSIYALGKVTAIHACKMYRDVYGLKARGAIFYNHESEIRPHEYVSRKITKSAARISLGKQKKLVLGDISIKIDWGYAKDFVKAAHKIMQLKQNDFYIIGTGKQYSITDFVKKSFDYVNLDYKKYVKIDKKLFRKGKTSSLLANISKAQKTFNYKVETNLDKLISIMMENDLKNEKNQK